MSPAFKQDSSPKTLTDGSMLQGLYLADDQTCNYRCTSKPQRRNWSITAKGALLSNKQVSADIFLKQFVDRNGNALHAGFEREIQAHEIAATVLSDSFRIPQLKLADPENLVLGYEVVDVMTFDEILRQSTPQFEKYFEVLLPQLPIVLERLMRSSTHHEGLLEHRLDVPGPRSIVFAGLDIRNIGVNPNVCRGRPDALYVFDFQRAYVSSIFEASWKFLASVGFLNWGRPITRFAKGPDFSLLDRTLEILRPYANTMVIKSEFHSEISARSRRVKALNGFEAAVKRVGLATLGRRYLASLSRYVTAIVE